MSLPWPDTACCVHSCPEKGCTAFLRDGTYCESTGYRWYTAGWNSQTGRWYAVCDEGHKLRGRAAA